MTPIAPLPSATRERWQPMRCGLINLFKYDDQQFRFENGRLLLRGNNGTGKSRVLALTLPFLFDGQTTPYRVEPDQDLAKRMSWNLLMGRHDDRVGYTWLEMGRCRDSTVTDDEHFMTIGCGMSAVRGKSGVTTWFFITDQRIGADLSLCQGRVPLSKARLVEALGDRGRVIESAADYRDAIDTAFFGLGTYRYEAMLRLLIELRRPQLSRTLNEEDLSRALSDALPPLDGQVIQDVATALSELEKDRQRLDDYQSAQAGVKLFLEDYRRYARIAAKRTADPVRKTHSAYETAARALRQADKDAAEARRHLAESEQSLNGHKQEHARLETRVKTLAASPEMRSLEELQSAEAHLADLETRHQEDRDRQQQLQTEADRRQARDDEARVAMEKQAKAMDISVANAQTCADHAAMGEDHRRLAIRLDRTPPIPAQEARRAIEPMNQRAEKQGRSVKLMQRRAKEVHQHQQAADQAGRSRDETRARVQMLIGQSREAGRAIESRAEEAIKDYAAWRAGLQYLATPETDAVVQLLRQWIPDAQAILTNRSPLVDVVDQAMRSFRGEHARLTAEAKADKEQLAAEVEHVQAEIAVLEAGRHTPPPSPHTRDAAVREGRPGAPLWRLLDFRPGVDEATRCGVEAAMESAGILDAWLMPDGQLLHNTDDVFLLSTPMLKTPGRAPDRPTLDRLLAPAGDLPEGISPSAVRSILYQIGWEEDAGREMWINRNGQWRNGPLGGCWHKPDVQHIGQAAREAERQRRLNAHREQAAALSLELHKADKGLVQLEVQGGAAEQEAQAAPGDGAIRQAFADLSAIQEALNAARNEATEAEQASIQASQRLAEAQHQRDRDAVDTGLSEWLTRLDELTHHLNKYRLAVVELKHQCERLMAASQNSERTRQELDSANFALSQSTTRASRAAQAVTQAKERVLILQGSIGVDAEQVRDTYRRAQVELDDVKQAIEQAQQDKEDAIGKQSRAEEKRKQAEQEHEDKQASRDRAIKSLHDFAAQGFLRIAGPAIDTEIETDVDWSATRGVEIARRLDSAFQEHKASDDAWQQVKGELQTGFEQLKETLGPKGYPPQNEPSAEDLYRITVQYQNQTRSVVELETLLSDEVSHRQGLLDAREKEVIENHLIDEVAVHLHGLIQAGERQVAQMNTQLEGRATSTGMELRFKWAVVSDADDGLVEARRQLLRSPDAQTPEQRVALADFLQHQIRATQERTDLLPWRESLAEALDYRRWHRFGVERRPEPGVPWQPLTKKTHGTGSGGEKAIALTIPQFAAASAHYSSASPLAPRLIMLDEAFVGVDPDMRSKCMALLAEFDLDFIMTSESEWGCYPGLDGNAIYQLATRQGMDAILCTRWAWNGRRKTQDRAKDRPHDKDEPLHDDPTSLYEGSDTP